MTRSKNWKVPHSWTLHHCTGTGLYVEFGKQWLSSESRLSQEAQIHSRAALIHINLSWQWWRLGGDESKQSAKDFLHVVNSSVSVIFELVRDFSPNLAQFWVFDKNVESQISPPQPHCHGMGGIIAAICDRISDKARRKRGSFEPTPACRAPFFRQKVSAAFQHHRKWLDDRSSPWHDDVHHLLSLKEDDVDDFFL